MFMVGATDTASGPEVAPEAMLTVIDVPFQESMVIGVSFICTRLAPWLAPNPVPEITTWLPTAAVVALTLLMIGAGVAAELSDTLSKVAMARLEVLRLVTPRPK